MSSTNLASLKKHQRQLRQCRRCPEMHGPPVTGEAALSPVMLIGQAPGNREIVQHRPFAWTAGKTMFGWFERIGLDEEAFRQRVYMAAVCRCFPGKKDKGGDRVPSTEEIANCKPWMERELELLQPKLLIPVGKLAISQFMPVDPNHPGSESGSDSLTPPFRCLDLASHRTGYHAVAESLAPNQTPSGLEAVPVAVLQITSFLLYWFVSLACGLFFT